MPRLQTPGTSNQARKPHEGLEAGHARLAQTQRRRRATPAAQRMNYRLLLQYDGTDFHGWQTQAELRTVQGELTRALSLLDDREVVVHGSGRTDAGVHAEGQVATAQLQKEFEPLKLRN